MKTLQTLAVLGIALSAADAAVAQRAVIIARHAERQDDADEKSPLSEAGVARAKALARHLRDAGIRAILTSETPRAVETAGPLATALGLEPLAFPAPSPEALNAAILTAIAKEHAENVVLVIGHTDTIPGLLRSLGVAAEVSIPRTEYDNLWVVVPSAKAPPTVLRLRF